LLVYAHYFGFFIIFIQLVVFIFSKKEKKEIVNLSIYFLILTLLYLPNISTIVERFMASSSNGTWVESPNGLVSLYDMIWRFSNKPITAVFCIFILGYSFIKYLLKKQKAPLSFQFKMCLFWFFFPFFFLFIVSFWIPSFIDRYLIFITPAFYILIVLLSSSILKKWNIYLSFFLLILFAFTTNFNPSNKRDVKNLILTIQQLKKENNLIYISPKDFNLNFAYYYDISTFCKIDKNKLEYKITSELEKQKVYHIYDFNEIKPHSSSHILFLDAAADFSNPLNNILGTLKRDYKLSKAYKFDEIFTIYEFKK
jgi:hypothetical protein